MSIDLGRVSLVVAGIVACVLAGPAAAHHSHASLNQDDVRMYRGVITRYSWTMPHVFLRVRGPDRQGRIVEYTIESLNPPAMSMAGWSRDTFEPGDEVIWRGPHDHNEKRHYTGIEWIERVSDGKRFSEDPKSLPDIVPSENMTGLWKRYPFSIRHYRPPEGWPLNEAGQAMVAAFNENDSPIARCINPGPPKSMILPFPFFITRPDEQHIVIERELMEEKRIIHIDHEHGPIEPSILGHSIGTYEGEELVVTTTDFVADRWGTHTGIDSSEQKRLVERFRLSDDGLYLHADITVTDPAYLTEPHTFEFTWAKLPHREVIQAPCTMESAKLHLEAGFEEP